MRLDIGLQYIDIQYTGTTVILRTISSGPQNTIYYLDRGKQFQLNMYANLTVNSSKPDHARKLVRADRHQSANPHQLCPRTGCLDNVYYVCTQ
ncbi:MAG: hypothetical protein WEF53_01440 [Bacteroidota bacterium]